MKTPPTATSPESIWKATLSELPGQMAKGTFNAWLSNATLIRADDTTITIGLHNQRAVDWVSNRLKETINRTVDAIAGRPWLINFEVVPTTSPSAAPLNGLAEATTTDNGNAAATEEPPVFAGFDTPKSDWTATPDTFFTHLAKHEDGSVTKLVAQVIYRTWGQFEDKKRQTRVWEWPVTMGVLHEVCGIKSRTSLYTAIWDARAKGYVIQRQLSDPDELVAFQERYGYKPVFTLRLRQRDDEIDFPTTPRPGYGSRA